MINIFGSGADGHIELFTRISKNFHSPSATTQLSGARSTTELIALDQVSALEIRDLTIDKEKPFFFTYQEKTMSFYQLVST